MCRQVAMSVCVWMRFEDDLMATHFCECYCDFEPTWNCIIILFFQTTIKTRCRRPLCSSKWIETNKRKITKESCVVRRRHQQPSVISIDFKLAIWNDGREKISSFSAHCVLESHPPRCSILHGIVLFGAFGNRAQRKSPSILQSEDVVREEILVRR